MHASARIDASTTRRNGIPKDTPIDNYEESILLELFRVVLYHVGYFVVIQSMNTAQTISGYNATSSETSVPDLSKHSGFLLLLKFLFA